MPNSCLSVIIWIKKSATLKNVVILIFLIIALSVIGKRIINQNEKEEDRKVNLVLENKSNVTEVPVVVEQKNVEPSGKNKNLPDKFFIKVPFTSQAPFAVWDEIHEEACEEASLIMLNYFFSGKELTRSIAEKEIQELVDFQNKKSGDFRDTTAQETADLYVDFYGEIEGDLKLEVVYDFKKDDLRKYLADGFPIIVPAAGRELNNPNFTAPGPLYHNLVLVGYDGDIIITNDPGTKKGEGFEYNIDVLYNAIHDFPGKPEDINQGRKAMIIVKRNK